LSFDDSSTVKEEKTIILEFASKALKPFANFPGTCNILGSFEPKVNS
jgi:hypothetical protein